MNARFLAVLLIASVAGFAGDWDFDHVVKAIESHYGVKRTHIPFMGVANFALKVRRPAGASEFHLAVFQDLDSSPEYRDAAGRDRFMSAVSGHGLRPMIATHSRRGEESTYIYMAGDERSAKILIVNFHGDGATVVQAKADVKTLLRCMKDPEGMAESLSAEHDQ